jgi:hypothetical protein
MAKVQKTQESTESQTQEPTAIKAKAASLPGIEKMREELVAVKAEAKVPAWGLKAMEAHIKKTERRYKNAMDPKFQEHRKEARLKRRAKKLEALKAIAAATQAAS